MRKPTPTPAFPQLWPLLFPLTYALHIVEEYYGGERFFNWMSRIVGIQLTEGMFVRINSIAWTAMLLVCLAATRSASLQWTLVALATTVLLNGTAHTVASLITWTYSPGLVTGLLLWVPLGIVTLRRSRPMLSRGAYWASVAFGLALHGMVTLVAVTNSSQ